MLDVNSGGKNYLNHYKPTLIASKILGAKIEV